MNDTKYRVRIENMLSEEFGIGAGLKQDDDAFLPFLFNVALKLVIWSMQKIDCGIGNRWTELKYIKVGQWSEFNW